MRFSKKTLILAACMVLCMTMTAFGTVAYLTDRASVKNTFTVGSIAIDVDEEKVNLYGEPMVNVDTDGDGTPDKEMPKSVADTMYPNAAKEEIRVLANKYKLIPGAVYAKDPTMTVDAGSESAYLRMSVKINCISQLRELLGADFLPQNYQIGWDSSIWPCVGIVEDAASNSATYVFNYYKVVDQSEAEEKLVLEPLFKQIVIPGELTVEQAAMLKDLEIEIEGQAIQTAAFEDKDGKTALENAWEAFGEQYKRVNAENGNTENNTDNNNDNTVNE